MRQTPMLRSICGFVEKPLRAVTTVTLPPAAVTPTHADSSSPTYTRCFIFENNPVTKLPNLLTLIRIFLVPFLVAALVQQDFRLYWGNRVLVANDFFALIVFLAAALTDLLDGYLARRWKQVTTVGTLLDPIADKLLVSAALISLVQIRLLPGWLVVLIISREFAVSGLRSIAAAEGYTIQASELGKSKMMLQVLGITLVMLSVRWPGYIRASHVHDVGGSDFWAGVGNRILCAVLEESGFGDQTAAA